MSGDFDWRQHLTGGRMQNNDVERPSAAPTSCPSCGYCSHCGRGGAYMRPAYPIWFGYGAPDPATYTAQAPKFDMAWMQVATWPRRVL